MFTKLRAYLRDNSGDSNVSKMTWVALVFVVGTILLILVTSAFRNPIHRWFDKVSNDWFASENGMFEADNPFMFAEKAENGTIKGAKYRLYYDNGGYDELEVPEGMQNGFDTYCVVAYNPDGSAVLPGFGPEIGQGNVSISEDGSYITIDGYRYEAVLE